MHSSMSKYSISFCFMQACVPQTVQKQHVAECDETPNQAAVITSEQMMEMQVLNRSGSSPGVERAASHSSHSFARAGRQTLYSSSSGYDSCPAAIAASQSTQGCTMANTAKFVDHSPHRKCYLRNSQHLSTPIDAPVSAQQCHF